MKSTENKQVKKKKVAREWRAWMSMGTDGHPIGLDWWRENLQNNVRHIRVSIIPTKDLKCLKLRKSSVPSLEGKKGENNV